MVEPKNKIVKTITYEISSKPLLKIYPTNKTMV